MVVWCALKFLFSTTCYNYLASLCKPHNAKLLPSRWKFHVHLATIIKLLPLCEGNMAICSPEAHNITFEGDVTRTQGQQLFYYTEKCTLSQKLNADQHCVFNSFAVKLYPQSLFVSKFSWVTENVENDNVWSLQVACASPQSNQFVWIPKDPNMRKVKSVIILDWKLQINLSLPCNFCKFLYVLWWTP